MVERQTVLHVEVVHASAHQAWSRKFSVPVGTTVREAVTVSGLEKACPGVDASDDNLGIFGRRVRPDRPLRDGDRVEVYRPLSLDPKEARRRRAAGKR